MDLKEHIINLPRKVYIGNNILEEINAYFTQLNLGSPYLFVTGPFVGELVTKRVLESIPQNKEYEIITVKDATLDYVYATEEAAKKIGAKVIVGIGGGKSIDVAKYAAYKVNSEFVSIPTAPSHDGITSPFASIKGLGKAVSVKAKEPVAIVSDIGVISSAPRRLINAGIGDTVGKIVAVKDWKLASKLRGEYYGDYTASLALMSAKHALMCTKIIEKDVEAGVRILMEALITSGVAMGMAGSTRPASGSEHLFAHAIEIMKPDVALHGELVGIGTIMMAYLHGLRWKRIKKSLMSVGFPVRARDLGIPDEMVLKALTIAHSIRPERYTILGDRGLTWRSAEKIAQDTGVID